MDSRIIKMILAVAMILVGSIGLASWAWKTDEAMTSLHGDSVEEIIGKQPRTKNSLDVLGVIGLVLVIYSIVILYYGKYSDWYDIYMAVCAVLGVIYILASFTVFDSIDPEKDEKVYEGRLSFRQFGGILIAAGVVCTIVGIYLSVIGINESILPKSTKGSDAELNFDFEF
jgi:uncharacterized membrane protein